MTTRVESPQGSAAPAPVRSSSRRRWIVGILAVVLVIASGYATYWWTHPDLFPGSGASFGVDPLPVRAATLHSTVIYPSTEQGEATTVRIHAMGAHFAENSAQATLSFNVCLIDGDPIGAGGGPLSRWCSEIRPIDGDTVFNYRPDSNEAVVVTLTPTRPGLARVDSVWIDYTMGESPLSRRGTQTLDFELTTTAK